MCPPTPPFPQMRWVSHLLRFYQKYLAWIAANNSRLWEGIKWLMLYLGNGTLGTQSRLRTLINLGERAAFPIGYAFRLGKLIHDART